jgi:hypothetical protein
LASNALADAGRDDAAHVQACRQFDASGNALSAKHEKA